MISLDEVNRTILELENKDTTYAVCERLAWLYIVKDHLSTQIRTERSLLVPEDSEFLQAINGKSESEVFRIIDEHMEVLKIVYPKEYNLIIGKIKNI